MDRLDQIDQTEAWRSIDIQIAFWFMNDDDSLIVMLSPIYC